MAEAALDPIENFDFITDFLGPDATLTRYRALGGAGEYQTVVDVMTAPSLGRLQDFSDAVWYPSTAPVNYRPYDVAPRQTGLRPPEFRPRTMTPMPRRCRARRTGTP